MIFWKSIVTGVVEVLLISTLSFQTKAQKIPVYPFSDIPMELLENSNAVIRENIKRYEVVDIGKGKSYVKKAVTILNKKADIFAEVSIGYDKISKITALSARIYNQYGKLVTQLKSKDIEDYSSYDGFSIYSDNRIKYFDLRYAEYPYTIEYEYETTEDGFMSLENWMPYTSFNTASQQSELEIITPEKYDINFIELNMPSCVKEEIKDGKKITSWDFGSYPAIEPEPRMPSLQTILPTVLTAPSNFELEGYAGSMNSWETFGLWEKNLNEGRDELPSEFAVKVKEMTKNETSRTGKIKKLYEYLQANTRYISIQLGIGGWQTFPATDVAANGYGDCKALSNYMKSMLKAVDIDSYYTLVRAGSSATDIRLDFPGNQFNHMILCVPNYQDTIWLECTSQDNPFGYLGTFTGNRDVLVINDDGGKIVHTPIYSKEINTQNQHILVDLKENGSAFVSLKADCRGLQFDNYSHLLDIGESEQKKWLLKNLDFPSFELSNFKFARQGDFIPKLTANVDVFISRLASVSGKRLFICPDIINQTSSLKIPQKERKYPFELTMPFADADTVEIEIPSEYHPEHLPGKITIKSLFGDYSSEVISEMGKVFYIRHFSMNKGVFPPEEYINFIEFMNKVADADKGKLVFVKST